MGQIVGTLNWYFLIGTAGRKSGYSGQLARESEHDHTVRRANRSVRRGAFTYRGRSVREDGWSSTDCARSAVDALQFDFPPIPWCYSTPLQPFPPSPSQRPRDAARASLRRKKGVNVDAIELCLIVIKKREPRIGCTMRRNLNVENRNRDSLERVAVHPSNFRC